MYFKIKEFIKLESASGILIIFAAISALVIANSPVSYLYDALLQTNIGIHVQFHVNQLELTKPLLLWINDGLMVIFFLLVGLELKREILGGALSNWSQIALPGIAALGGILVPVAIYIAVNYEDPIALDGWAIPAATDIAFALGVLALLGSRIPPSLKIFLMALAIIDDIGAIIIIAIFYSGDLSTVSLIVSLILILMLGILNWCGVKHIAAYLIVGVVLWVAVLQSGVHATLTGVILAFFIPFKERNENFSPLRKLEVNLHPWTAYGILPLFAFVNAGVSLEGISFSTLLSPVPLGIAMGLFFGKQIGVFMFSWIAIKSGIARLPTSVDWRQMYGVSVLCGIGFTMSLLIGALAFEHGGPYYAVEDRIGILLGSFFSAVIGYLILRTRKRVETTAVNS
ncbi:MAG: Na+/H+ antiporter NhaA [Candidatus Scalindua sp.]